MISMNNGGRAFKRLPSLTKDERRSLEREVARRMRFAATKDDMARWVSATPYPWQRTAYSICLEHEVAYDDLATDDLSSPIVACRQAVMHALQQQHGMSLPTIGHYLGRDHATVLHGIRRHEARLNSPNLPHKFKEMRCKA